LDGHLDKLLEDIFHQNLYFFHLEKNIKSLLEMLLLSYTSDCPCPTGKSMLLKKSFKEHNFVRIIPITESHHAFSDFRTKQLSLLLRHRK
jgi:hypothetical protein